MTLPEDDARWSALRDADGTPFDPRPALGRLERGDIGAWDELFPHLHRQGTVGDASYAALPELIRLHELAGVADWRTYTYAVMVEDARRSGRNPPIPAWVKEDYDRAWRMLEFLALSDFQKAEGDLVVHSIIATLAMAKGSVTLARIATFAEEELEQLLIEAGVQ